MSTKQFKDFISSVFSPVSHLGRKFRRFLKRISRAVRRELLLIAKRAKRAGAGFVLPTVTMVMLVVVLLTLSIAFRSFERVNQARNVRVNQALLSASTPALDRAKAKIDDLINFNPATNVGGTPSEKSLLQALEDNNYKELNASGGFSEVHGPRRISIMLAGVFSAFESPFKVFPELAKQLSFLK